MIRGHAAGRCQRRQRGFTLLELLITLAVVCILSALAWPGYGAVMQRAQRHEGRLALLQVQHLQEIHYATHLRYADRLGNSAEAGTLVASSRSQAGHYLISVQASTDGQRYRATARAAPDGAQRRDLDCQQLAIDETGRRYSADVLGSWSEADPHRCWQ